MEVQLISHASVIVKCGEVRIWSDPWLISKVFNNSWTLFPEPEFENDIFETTDYIWISHEHPDHLNIPTLRSLPDYLKERVTILFQEKNSEKVFDALRKLGFKSYHPLPNRRLIKLTSGVKIYCYQTHLIDSCLVVIFGDKVVFNVNDAELDEKDCRLILDDIGHVDVVLNQFSLAGYAGYKDKSRYLPIFAKEKLERVEKNHLDLNASVTIPFASFIYFSCIDNRYMNQYVNKPADVFRHLKSRDLQCSILYPGDIYEVSKPYDSTESLKKYDDLFRSIEHLQYDTPEIIPIKEIKESFDRFSTEIHERYPKFLISFLRPLTFYIEDLDKAIEISVYSREFSEINALKSDVDILVNSQPLNFSFKFSFGFETLSISARFTVLNNYRYWMRLKRISILNNSEIYLKPRYFLDKGNLQYLRKRISSGLCRQIRRKLRRNKRIQYG